MITELKSGKRNKQKGCGMELILHPFGEERIWRMMMNEKDAIIKKIIKETGRPRELAEPMAEKIRNLRFELQPCVNAWLNGKKVSFFYKGISLEQIMEKESVSYIEAVFVMSVLMKYPDEADGYMDRDFRRK